jgi:hypothetical protein
MEIVYDDSELEYYMNHILIDNAEHPILVDKYLTGKEVATKTIAVSASNNVEVNTANLSAGSYIYKVFAGDKVATGKLIKQ